MRRASIAAAALALVGAGPAAAADDTYVVLYKSPSSLPADATATVERAGGRVVQAWPQIGVVVARSGAEAFGARVRADRRVEGAASVAGLGTRVDGRQAETGAAATADTLSALQWDMRQIHAFEAHAVEDGDREVLVGNIDTGLDFTHPDIAPVYDASNSADCSSGAPLPLQVGNDTNGHGTHTGGTIAAAANGQGIVGVAPGVRLAGIKASGAEDLLFPHMVICSFMWAGQRGMDVTNNSYYADPWLFNCRNDEEQRAIWKAEQRAIRFAQQRGTTVVASEGNNATDLSHPTYDDTSPDHPPGTEQEREITNACVVVPVEVPGVVGVTAVGNQRQDTGGYMKSFYSSYGVSTADVTAPGGDSRQITPEAQNGRVLSTWPFELPCSRSPQPGYCYLQGTSMAAPHVTGVAALILSREGADTPPGAVEAALQRTADPQPCPASYAHYATFPQLGGAPQDCQGGAGHTSWYGAGQVNALRAVTE